jgi:uncharacterized repeat protein (TIGR01451 family)
MMHLRNPKALLWTVAAVLIMFLAPATSAGAPTPAGTNVLNQAVVNYTSLGAPVTRISNTDSFPVDEILGHTLTKLDVANVPVSSGGTAQVLSFRLDNTGNGTDSFVFSNSVASGFTPDTMDIYIDTNGTGTYDPGDTLYNPASPPPVPGGGSLNVFVVSDIPASVVEGDDSEITLTSRSSLLNGAEPVGYLLPAQGDGVPATDAIVGPGSITGSDSSFYEVKVTLSMVKSAAITDPLGGSQALSGATVDYTISVSVTGSGSVTNLRVTDQIPTHTTFINGSAWLDATNFPFDSVFNSITNSIEIDIGTLDSASGVRDIRFSVTID